MPDQSVATAVQTGPPRACTSSASCSPRSSSDKAASRSSGRFDPSASLQNERTTFG